MRNTVVRKSTHAARQRRGLRELLAEAEARLKAAENQLRMARHFIAGVSERPSVPQDVRAAASLVLATTTEGTPSGCSGIAALKPNRSGSAGATSISPSMFSR